MKILFVFGTRPEAIKLAPLIKVAKRIRGVKAIVCLTAQHREMLDQVIDFFQIKPDYDLNIMSPAQGLFDVTSQLIIKLKDIFLKESPDWVVVQGDTTTTFIASLCAFYSKIKVAHVEAGLRTNNKLSPFPEEMNRILTTRIADIHFAPTLAARDYLLDEKIPAKQIFVTGNTGIDALFYALRKLKNGASCKKLGKIDFSKKLVLITLHRRESFGTPLQEICRALRDISISFPQMELVCPVHLNPNVRKIIFKILQNRPNVHLLEPLEYPVFVSLMQKSYIILTDSGGIQEEAPSLGKPVLILREISERSETIKFGTAILAGTTRKGIVRLFREVLTSKHLYKKMARKVNLYGNGKASVKIIQILSKGLRG